MSDTDVVDEEWFQPEMAQRFIKYLNLLVDLDQERHRAAALAKKLKKEAARLRKSPFNKRPVRMAAHKELPTLDELDGVDTKLRSMRKSLEGMRGELHGEDPILVEILEWKFCGELLVPDLD